MDEYDELFEVQDDFEEQFADELEVLAEMEGEQKRRSYQRVASLWSNC